MKENDLLLNIIENPDFSVSDFQTVGLNANNTELKSQDVYMNSPKIQEQPIFQNNSGEFDKTKFQNVYANAALAYNMLDQNTEQDEPIFSKYDIFAPKELKPSGPQFGFSTVYNPDQRTYGLVGPGEQGTRTKTPEEIAQGQLSYNRKTNSWEKAPEQSLIDNIIDSLSGNPKVMAAYDEDVDVNGNIRGTKGFDENNIAYVKGQYKINPETGTYYYETLDGRNSTGKTLLHISDILTEEDSAVNSFDFLDSDDIDKSLGGTILKNTALVGAMFLPYVGPAVTGLTILNQAIGLGATLGKIAGLDEGLMNDIEASTHSFNAMETRSEYSKQNQLSSENLISMAGDVIAQLWQQRKIFEYAATPFMGKAGATQAGRDALEAKKLEEFNQLYKTPVPDIRNFKSAEQFIIAKEKLAIKTAQENQTRAAQFIADYTKKYQKYGENIARGYMTLLTVNDSYNTAKMAGASDFEAALLTLGYAAGEWNLLKTDIGKWVLPEVKANKIENNALVQTITAPLLKGLNTEKAAIKGDPIKANNFITKVINLGKKAFQTNFDAGNLSKKSFSQVVKSTIGAGIAEGTEEVSEEILGDISKVIYNGLQQLKAPKDRKEIEIEPIGIRYALNFLGGVMGGAVANAKLSYHAVNTNFTTKEAAAKIIYKIRNGEIGDIKKAINNYTYASKNISATETIEDADGNLILKPVTDESQSQDAYVKNIANKWVDSINDTINYVGGNISDQSLFNINAEQLPYIRANALASTTSVSRVLQQFGDLQLEAITVMNKINELESSLKNDLTTNDHNEKDTEKYKQVQEQIKEQRAKLDDIKTLISEYTSGARSIEFIAPGLLESAGGILAPFAGKSVVSVKGYAEWKTNRKWEDLPESKQTELRQDYQKYLETQKKDQVYFGTAEYLSMSRKMSESLSEIVKEVRDFSLFHVVKNSLQHKQDNLNYLVRYSELSDEEWIAQFQSQLDSINTGMSSELIQNILDAETIEEVQKLTNIPFNTNPGISEGSALIDYKIKVFEQILQGYQFLNPIITVLNTQSSIYLPNSVKVQLESTFSKLHEQQGQILGFLYEVLGFSTNQKYTMDLADQLFQSQKNTLDAINTIQKVKSTPILDYLDSFSLIFGSKPFKFSDVYSQLQKTLNATKNNVSEFSLGSDENIQNINEAIKLLQKVKAVVEGARLAYGYNLDTDENLYTRFFGGINETINQVHKNSKALKNDTWEGDLPTINTETADDLILDLDNLLQELQSLVKLNAINRGQKLNTHTKVEYNISYISYDTLQALIDVVPDDKDKAELLNVKNQLKLINDKNKPLNLSLEQRKQLHKEKVLVLDTIHSYLNKPRFKDPKELAKIINYDNFKLKIRDSRLLTDELQDISPDNMVWLLSVTAAMSGSEFYNTYKTILNPNQPAPLAGQEFATWFNVATVMQNKTIALYQDVYSKSITEKFNSLKTPTDREKFLIELGYEQGEAKNLSSDDLAKHIKHDIIPKYSNIIFTEGVPGSGKTRAVIYYVKQFLEKAKKETLANTWIVSVADADTKSHAAEKLQSDLNVEGRAMSHQELLQETITNWQPYKVNQDGSVQVENATSVDGEILYNDKLQLKHLDEVPSLIIIDEISQLSTLDLQRLNKLAQDNNITIIALGDLDQSKIYGKYKLNKDYFYEIGLERHQLIHSIKLGSSLRTANVQKTLNNTAAQQAVSDVNAKTLTLHYWQDDKAIHGDKVYTKSQEVATDNKKVVVRDLSDSQLTQIMSDIDLMVNDPDVDVINYVYYDTTTKLYQKLVSLGTLSDGTITYKGKQIKLWTGNAALGKEGKYWILELNPLMDRKPYKENLYTCVSRAETGSIILDTSGNQFPLKNIKDTDTYEETLGGKEAINRYTKNRKEIIDIDYTIPTKSTEQPSNTTEESTEEKLNENINNSESSSEQSQQDTTESENVKQFRELIKQDEKYQGLLTTLLDKYNVDSDKYENNALILTLETPIYIDPKITKYAKTDEVGKLKLYYDHIEVIYTDNHSVSLGSINDVIDNYPAIFNNDYINNRDTQIQENINQTREVWNNQVKQLQVKQTSEGVWEVTSELDFPIMLGPDAKQSFIYLRINPDKSKTPIVKITNEGCWDSNGKVYHLPDDLMQQLLKAVNINIDANNNPIVLTDENQKDLATSTEDKSFINKISLAEDMMNLFHSHATFELGGHYEDGKFVSSAGANSRIDNVNGLKRIATLLNPSIDYNDREAAIKYLQDLKRILRTVPSKSEIISQIQTLLGIDNLYVTYAIKKGVYRNIEFNSEGANKFIKDPTDECLDDRGIKQESYTNLIAIIGDSKNGDLIEIDLQRLNNPNNYLTTNSKNPLDIQSDYMQLLNSGISERNAILRIIDKYKNRKEYSELINLCQVYANTYGSNIIEFQPDPEWTIAKDAEQSSVVYNVSRGKHSLQEKIVWDGKLQPLKPLIDNSELQFSKVYVNTKAKFGDANPGDIFVLVSYKKFTSDRAMFDQYARQVNDENIAKEVRLVRLQAPTFTMREYIKSFEDFIASKDPSKNPPLGNILTSLYILRSAYENPDTKDLFLQKLESVFGKDGTKEILDTLDEVIKLQNNSPSEVSVRLKGTENFNNIWNLKDHSLASQFQNIIKQLYNPVVFNKEEGTWDPSEHFDDEVINMFQQALKYPLYYNVTLNQDSSKNIGSQFALANIDQKNYQVFDNIANKDIQIFGDLEPPTIGITKLSSWFRMQPRYKTKGIYINPSTKQAGTLDNKPYMDNRSIPSNHSDGPNIFQQMTEINKNNNDPNLALYNGKELIKIPLAGKINGQEIIKKDLTIENFKSENNKFTFTLNTNGKQYNAEVDLNTRQISLQDNTVNVNTNTAVINKDNANLLTQDFLNRYTSVIPNGYKPLVDALQALEVETDPNKIIEYQNIINEIINTKKKWILPIVKNSQIKDMIEKLNSNQCSSLIIKF